MTKEKEFAIAAPEYCALVKPEKWLPAVKESFVLFITERLNSAVRNSLPFESTLRLLSFYGDSWGYYE